MFESRGGTRSVTLAGRPATELLVDGLEVRVLSGPDRGKSAQCPGGSFYIGTAPANNLILSDGAASRRHAALHLTPDGVRVQDLGSKNGTWLNGARISEAVVQAGGRLQLGNSVVELRACQGNLVVYPDEETEFCDMVAASEKMRSIFSLVRQMAKFDLPVTITGETGTGKELIARALHSSGSRREKGYQVLDCGSMVRDLLASELFGHEKGAFTGADQARAGLFEEAKGGTVFLDEVGEIDLSLQPYLLRVLETREITRLGSRRPVPVDFRLVSATHRDLRAMSEAGTFRSDLYFRLSTVTIRIPALRERKEDIPLLACAFLTRCAQRNGISVPLLTREGEAALAAHDYPGNIRELRNLCEALCIRADGRAIDAHAVAELLLAAVPPKAFPGVPTPVPAATTAVPAGSPEVLEETLGKHEKQAILEMLIATNWNRKLAAQRLKISRTTLYARMARYGLVPPDGSE